MTNLECYNKGVYILSNYTLDLTTFGDLTTYVYLQECVSTQDARRLDTYGWDQLGPLTWMFNHDDN